MFALPPILHPEAARVHPAGAVRFALLHAGVITEVRVTKYVGAIPYSQGFAEMFAVTAYPPEDWPMAPLDDQESGRLFETRLLAELGRAQSKRAAYAQDLADTRAQEVRLVSAVARMDGEIHQLEQQVLREKNIASSGGEKP